MSLVRAGWKWLPAYLEPCVPGSCPWLVWLPACLEPCIPGSCVLGWCGYLHALNLVSLVGVSLVRVLVGSGYLHALNLVSLVRVSLLVRVLVGSDYLHTLNLVSLVRVLGWCFLVGVVTCMP